MVGAGHTLSCSKLTTLPLPFTFFRPGAQMIPFCMLFCKMHWKSATLVRSVLRAFSWVSVTAERMDTICRLGAIETTTEIMRRHNCNPSVLAPAVAFLTRAASALEWCMNHILEQKLIPLIISALRALHNEEELQLEGTSPHRVLFALGSIVFCFFFLHLGAPLSLAGLRILQTLSTTPEGYKQISETKGGWQSICQGTSLGNALMHELQGEFHNPGWAIGDTPNPTINDRRKQASVDLWQKKYLGLSVKYAWTSRSLMEFQGLSMSAKTLARYGRSHDPLARPALPALPACLACLTCCLLRTDCLSMHAFAPC